MTVVILSFIYILQSKS